MTLPGLLIHIDSVGGEPGFSFAGDSWRAAFYLLGCLATASLAQGKEALPAGGLTALGDRLTESGRFRVSIASEDQAPQVQRMQSWIVHVETRDGRPLEQGSVSIAGAMPGHWHGLPTQPRMTAYLGAGNYRVDGLKFQMSGQWRIKVNLNAALAGARIADSASFDLSID